MAQWEHPMAHKHKWSMLFFVCKHCVMFHRTSTFLIFWVVVTKTLLSASSEADDAKKIIIALARFLQFHRSITVALQGVHQSAKMKHVLTKYHPRKTVQIPFQNRKLLTKQTPLNWSLQMFCIKKHSMILSSSHANQTSRKYFLTKC